MGFSPLADMSQRIPDIGRSSPRNGPVLGFTIHHQDGVDAHGEATRPGREVSANYWIKNDGTILPNIDENRRAWTTGAAGYPAGAASDFRNITVEVSNSGLPNGHISDAAWSSLIRLIADCALRHGFPIVRGTSSGIAVHRDFVPTECPGAHIMNNLSVIIAQAKQIAENGNQEEDDMYSDADRKRDTVMNKRIAEIHWMLDSRVRPQLDRIEKEIETLKGVTNGEGWGIRHLQGETRREIAAVKEVVDSIQEALPGGDA